MSQCGLVSFMFRDSMCRLCVYIALWECGVCDVYLQWGKCVWICEFIYVGLSGTRPVTFA